MSPVFSLPDDLIGTWWFETDDNNYSGLIVFYDNGRAIQFHTTKHKLPRNEVLKLWFTVEDTMILRFRHIYNHEGWLRYVDLTEDGISISIDEHKFPMKRADTLDLPNWWDSEVKFALNWMANKEYESANPKNSF